MITIEIPEHEAYALREALEAWDYLSACIADWKDAPSDSFKFCSDHMHMELAFCQNLLKRIFPGKPPPSEEFIATIIPQQP